MNKPRKEILNWILTIGLIILFAVTGWHRTAIAQVQQVILSTGLVQPDLNEAPARQPDSPVKLRLLDEAGNTVNLSDFQGKVVFLNFWATWCPPCKAEMPGIQQLYEGVKDKDIEFVMLSTDRSFADAKAFKEENSYSFPIYRLAADGLPASLTGRALPRTYVLDKQGAVVMEHEGMAKYDTPEFKKFLEKML